MSKRSLHSKFLAFVIGLSYCFVLPAQNDYEDTFNRQYQQNILKEEINGVYIPKDIPDALRQLDKLSSEEGRKKLIEGDESTVGDVLIYGLGKWMIVNWNFYEGSRLSHVLKEKGVSMPDDMARYLIITYYRYLKNIPLELDERAEAIRDKRQKEQEARNKSRVVKTG